MMYPEHPLYWVFGFIFAVGFTTLCVAMLWLFIATFDYVHGITRRTFRTIRHTH